ncbi:MAG: alanine racemase [Bacteroidetes bacterium]|nr:alanine racemase [Bacteroidota bacterium]
MISSPTLLLDKEKCLRNIGFMAGKAKGFGLKLRPHFKTHQSAEIGEWFRDFGISSCTVSSMKMAEYFKNHGWNDITLAFPINILEIDAINAIAAEINLNSIIVSTKTLDDLNQQLKSPLGLYIKINTGANRTGIEPENISLIDKLLEKISANDLMKFKGFLAHSGQTYAARNKEEIEKIHAQEIQIMAALKQKYINVFPEIEISVGDTPACSVSENYKGISEIRPGNFVFYDLMQVQIGSCNFDDIAIALASPVVAKHPERNEIIIHGGAVHLSKEYIFLENGEKSFGSIVILNENHTWGQPIKGAYLRSLSQDHGIIKTDSKEVFDSFTEGSLIGILPVHSCLTADMLKSFLTTDGKKMEMMKW